jgi:polyhydroxyalkanoate synthesis regulator protein
MQTVSEPILVKRYGTSRLYDTTRARYVTIDELRRWRAEGAILVVREAETGKDITRAILARR